MKELNHHDLVARTIVDQVDQLIKDGHELEAIEAIQLCINKIKENNIKIDGAISTPYINTISKEEEPDYPGNQEIEHKIQDIIRWNAMAMVVKANRLHDGLGGHISSYASMCTLYEVGF